MKQRTTTPAVCHVYGQLSQTGDRFSEVLQGFEQRGIPADIDFELDFSEDKLEACRRWLAAGNLVAPNVYPSYLDPCCTDSNWWSYSESECDRLLAILRERLDALGLGATEAINTYTPGNALIRSAQRHGFRYLLGFCAPIVSHDTHWKISQVGCPIGPFFSGPEDYRKPESPGDDPGLVIASMELRNPLTCFHHWSEGPFCPLNLLLGDRTVETGEWPIETMAAAEDFIRQSEWSGEERFFHINLQYFSSRKCFDFNERMLDWLATQARMGRLRFTGLAAHAASLRQSGGVLPQSTWWRGENMGQHCGAQRGDGIEAIISEDATGQWQFRAGQAGPERFFDYRKPWSYPAYDPQGLLPAADSYGIKLSIVKTTVCGNSARLEVSAHAPEAPGVRRFCLWKILPGFHGPFSVRHLDDGFRCVSVVPHPGGNGLSLVLEADLSTPRLFRVVVDFGGEASSLFSQNWEDLLVAETVEISGRPLTRVTTTVPYPLHITLRPMVNHPVPTSQIVGGQWSEGQLRPGQLWSGVLDGSRSVSLVRFHGIRAGDLTLTNPADLVAQAERRTAEWAHHAGVEVAPGTILRFGPQAPDWVAEAVRRGADQEVQRMNHQAEKLIQSCQGRLLASAHMACDLPPGSKGRAGAAFYDRFHSHSDAEFFSIFHDYGQSYLPGVAGWNQFWRINLGVRGLHAGSHYRVILNAYDPEGRGTIFRVTARSCDRDALSSRSPEVVLTQPFAAAQGLERRFDDTAFIQLSIPVELPVHGAINIHLYSDSDQAAYDRYTERPGFAFLSHAWLVQIL